MSRLNSEPAQLPQTTAGPQTPSESPRPGRHSAPAENIPRNEPRRL
jgi:hypothetical protein